MMDIHAGGHAQQEELKEMIKIMRTKFFLPIHGQYSMLAAHAELARLSRAAHAAAENAAALADIQARIDALASAAWGES